MSGMATQTEFVRWESRWYENAGKKPNADGEPWLHQVSYLKSPT